MLKMNNLLGLIKLYGFKGIKAWVKLKVQNLDYLVLKGQNEFHVFVAKYKDIIYLRANTSDYATFKQIYKDEEYNIKFDFDPKFIIDAGANIGLASIYFSNKFTAPQIVAIEPEESNLFMMRLNLKKYKNVSILPSALHHSPNEFLSIVDPGIGKWGFITESTDLQSNDKPAVATVKTTSVGSIMSTYNIHIIDILKIDIEGAEKSLFEKNYEDWLPKTRCIIIELHDRFNPGCREIVMNAINQYDFRYSEMGENLIFMNNKI